MDEVKKDYSKTIKGIKIGLNVLFYTVIALLLLYSIIVITSRGANDIPNIFGNGFLAVETDSMVGDKPDSFNPNDLIFVRILNEEQKDALVVGDIITFKDPAKGGALNTHRIVDVRSDGFIQTQGDNESQPDFYLLENSDIVAKYTGKWSGFGGFIIFLQSQLGFGLLVLLPIFLVLLYQGYVLLSNIFLIKKDKLEKTYEQDKAQAKLELEQEKERMRQELLEELKKENKEE
ncbi:signal peptidase I [Acholeplasma laidlawii]|uniref:signal peptidase I n=1 Tax=Acholeplasma laidlawii TaxID=2148 RepID=UPI0021F7F568|nr:signal peptidase I [Acholeplasma laidlawii]